MIIHLIVIVGGTIVGVTCIWYWGPKVVGSLMKGVILKSMKAGLGCDCTVESLEIGAGRMILKKTVVFNPVVSGVQWAKPELLTVGEIQVIVAVRESWRTSFNDVHVVEVRFNHIVASYEQPGGVVQAVFDVLPGAHHVDSNMYNVFMSTNNKAVPQRGTQGTSDCSGSTQPFISVSTDVEFASARSSMMSRTGGLLLPADVPRKYTLRKVALMDFVLEFVGPRPTTVAIPDVLVEDWSAHDSSSCALCYLCRAVTGTVLFHITGTADYRFGDLTRSIAQTAANAFKALSPVAQSWPLHSRG